MGLPLSVVNLYPRSRGQVRLASADVHDAPRVDAGLFSDAADIAPMLWGLRLVRRLIDTGAFARYHAHEVLPGRDVQSDEALTAYLRRAAGTAHHPVGTCRMGTDESAVVDPALRVRGVGNLTGSGRLDISGYCRRQYQCAGGHGGREGRGPDSRDEHTGGLMAAEHIRHWRIGDVEIASIVEVYGFEDDISMLLPDATPEFLQAVRLAGAALRDARGKDDHFLPVLRPALEGPHGHDRHLHRQ